MTHVDVLKSLGYDLASLTPVMLKTDNIRISDFKDRPEDLFYGDSYELRYVQGAVAETTAHVTLHQGILPNVPAEAIDAVLGDYNISQVRISNVGGWPSADGFTTVVAHLCDYDGALLELHNRLRTLPHIDSFPDFKPHVTLAYVRDGACMPSWLNSLNALSGKTLQVSGRFYGDH